jgi:hypothetical protein
MSISAVMRDETPTADAKKNQAIFMSRWFDRQGVRWRRRAEVGDDWLKDGLASLEFSMASQLRSPSARSVRPRSDRQGHRRFSSTVNCPCARFLRSLPIGPTPRTSAESTADAFSAKELLRKSIYLKMR